MKLANIVSIVFVFVAACNHDYNFKTPINEVDSKAGYGTSSTEFKQEKLPTQHELCVAKQGGDPAKAEQFCQAMDDAARPDILPYAHRYCADATGKSLVCMPSITNDPNTTMMPMYYYGTGGLR